MNNVFDVFETDFSNVKVGDIIGVHTQVFDGTDNALVEVTEVTDSSIQTKGGWKYSKKNHGKCSSVTSKHVLKFAFIPTSEQKAAIEEKEAKLKLVAEINELAQNVLPFATPEQLAEIKAILEKGSK